MIIEQCEGTAAELGIDGRTLGYMRQSGQAEIIGQTMVRTHRVCIWRVHPQQIPPTVGAHLRRARIELGMTLAELADAADVSLAGIGFYENGVGTPRILTTYFILDALDLRFAELSARIHQRVPPFRLPKGKVRSLREAILVAFDLLAPGCALPTKHRWAKHAMSFAAVEHQCVELGVDPLELWQEVDARLRWSR